MKKHDTLSGEELLRHALEECLEEDLSFVPPEREIARTHRFSEGFDKTMGVYIEELSEASKSIEVRKHFSRRYAGWAACVLLFLLCGGLFCYMVPFPSGGGSMTEGIQDESASGAYDSAAPQEAPEEEMTEEAAIAEEAGEAKETEDGGNVSGASPDKIVYCGQAVYPARQQEVPGALDYATVLVNCPVQDKNSPILFLTIGNTGEEDIEYFNRYALEVQLDGIWYTIPFQEDLEGQWLTLEAGMAVDEEIDLSGCKIDCEAEHYRLVACVGEDLIGAEFTFEKAFTEEEK